MRVAKNFGCRLAVVGLILLVLPACGPTFVRTAKGWQLSSAPYRILPSSTDRLGPDGWTINHYVKKDQDHLRKVSGARSEDLYLTRADDDGYAWVDTFALKAKSETKTMATLADRHIRELQRTSYVTYFSGTQSLVVPYDVHVLGENPFAVAGGEGFEVAVANVRVGASQPETLLYLALLRQPGANRVVRVVYVNRPRSFLAPLASIRELARRIAFGDAEPLPIVAPPPLVPEDKPKVETTAWR